MAIALVVKTAKGSADALTVTTNAADTTGANFTALVLTSTSDGAGGPSDNKSNTWNALTAELVGGGERVILYYAINPTVGTGHTFTFTPSSGSLPSICALAFSVVDTTTPFDAENAGGNSFGSTVQPGSVTPGQNDSLIIQGLAFNVTGTLAINESYVHTGDGTDYIDRAGNMMGLAAAYLIQTTAGATNPTWTHTPGSSSMAAVGAVFKPAGVGGRTTKNTRSHPLGISAGVNWRVTG